ncbi:histidine phosphatase family protein [Herbiconiux sp. L3-i23]|uniref:histidine phosphatase family protein n=1 Tax=Herbiconiux sp. L3-i23 TaxID=2905871 RepID=UPI002072ECB0|nr:histidine phosphatase family protein [Herbiconiux sp. L3-i23]
MGSVLLVRHAEADWASADAAGLAGPARDLIGLTRAGVQQAQARAEQLVDLGAERIVSSPMTRALQTASIIASRVGLTPVVEHDLREWGPVGDSGWDHAAMRAAWADLERSGGEWPQGDRRDWEPLSSVFTRVTAVLHRLQASAGRTVVVTHGVVIATVTGVDPGLGEAVSYRRIDGVAHSDLRRHA